MTEESSQQFTSTGTTSARNVSPTKASSVRPVNRQPIKQVSSNTQSPQTKYIYAGIGEQPLTQREFDENLKNLRSTLAEVESLLHGDMKNPENIKRCQQLLGFATSLRLPQEVKDKEIRSYPPAVQHLYETVKNEGSSASPAAQMAQTRHATTAMAQIMASDAHTVADLNAAIAAGWDINAKHLNPDGSYSTYVDYQGKVLSETAAFDERSIARLSEIMSMPDGPEKEKMMREHQAAAEANHQKAMKALGNISAAVQSGKLNQEELSNATVYFSETIKMSDECIEELKKQVRTASPKDKEKIKAIIDKKMEQKRAAEKGLQQTSRYYRGLGVDQSSKGAGSGPNEESSDIKNDTLLFLSEGCPKKEKSSQEKGSSSKTTSAEEDFKRFVENNAESAMKAVDKLEAVVKTGMLSEDRFVILEELNAQVSQAQGMLSATDVREVHEVVADAPAAQRAEDISSNLNGVGRVAIRSRAQINNTEPSGLEQPSATDALASMGNGNASDDLNFGIVPGGSIGTTPIKPAVRPNGFKRRGIAGTNRTFDLGIIGLASTTSAPKVPENTTESNSITTTDNSIATADNRSSDSRMTDLTATLGAKKENPLGKPLDLEETSDINLLTVRSQQSQATV